MNIGGAPQKQTVYIRYEKVYDGVCEPNLLDKITNNSYSISKRVVNNFKIEPYNISQRKRKRTTKQ
jgi:hypothetical protein